MQSEFLGPSIESSLMKKSLFARLALIAAVSVGAAGSAMAEVPAAVTAAIATMQADGVTVATTFLVAVIAVAAIKFLRSAK